MKITKRCELSVILTREMKNKNLGSLSYPFLTKIPTVFYFLLLTRIFFFKKKS